MACGRCGHRPPLAKLGGRAQRDPIAPHPPAAALASTAAACRAARQRQALPARVCRQSRGGLDPRTHDGRNSQLDPHRLIRYWAS